MADPAPLTTPRLSLRQWCEADRAPFATLNADAAVMRHFPAPLARAESDALVDRERAHIAEHGWGLWAVELRASGIFAGFVGLCRAPDTLPCAPCIEIGWRLARASWGQGYATEAARAALAHGFETLELSEIVSFTAVSNTPSEAVMKRLGMRPDGRFEHPKLPLGHPLRAHLLYRLRREEFGAQGSDQA